MLKYYSIIEIMHRLCKYSIGLNGITVGKYDDNYTLNSIICHVEFTAGAIKEYSANVIVKNMPSQV